ncbi:MAG: class I tRNA ligase family protein, partial [Pseudomonadota bacterium]
RWRDARQKSIDFILSNGLGETTINYKIRDWSVSRQRYWGAPIPIVYSPEGEPHAIPEEHLPWLLPDDVDFKPSGTAPLEQSAELKQRVEDLFGQGWTPEYETMDTFVCSSFYSLRYLADSNDDHLVSPPRERAWMPVDTYLGGVEHATRHLIYARFVQMALCDMGFVSVAEPYAGLHHQGLIQVNGGKMSKSKGNAISADSIVSRYGADVFRMFLELLGPYSESYDLLLNRANDATNVNTMTSEEVSKQVRSNVEELIQGPYRFAKRVWAFYTEGERIDDAPDSPEVLRAMNAAIKKVDGDLDALKFNTALSALMILRKEFAKADRISTSTAKAFLVLLSPFAPHLAERLWQLRGWDGLAVEQPWPASKDSDAADVSNQSTLPVMIDGKKRGHLTVPSAVQPDEVEQLVRTFIVDNRLLPTSATIGRVVFVPGRIVNVVTSA